MEKKLILVVCLILSINVSWSQSIDSSNYCNYYKMTCCESNSSLKTVYLSKLEIAQIVNDVMEELQFSKIRTFQLLKIDSATNVTALCYSEVEKCGFLFESSHNMIPNQNNRRIISLYHKITGKAYAEKVVGLDGTVKFNVIETLPKGLFILKSDSYWYQECSNEQDNCVLVSKSMIVEILKQDIRNYLEGL